MGARAYRLAACGGDPLGLRPRPRSICAEMKQGGALPC